MMRAGRWAAAALFSVSLLAGWAVPAMAGPVAGPVAGTGARSWAVIAHRGGMGLWPENSPTAFEHSIQAGYDYVEADVWATRDGVLVVWHDDRFGHGCRGGRKGATIAAMTWRQVLKVRCNGQPVMRFDALVNRLTHADAGRTALFAEPKRRGIAGRMLATARRLGSRLVLESFQPADLAGAPRSCLLGWDESVYTRALATPGVGCVGIYSGAATPDLRAAAHRQGLAVYAYTVDDPATMWDLVCGADPVDGLLTDRPDLAAAVSCARGAT